MSRPSKYSAKEKEKIVEMCLSGKMGIYEAVHRTGISETNIRRWISLYQAEGANAFMPSNCNRKYPVEVKRRAVEEYLAGKGSLQDICKNTKFGQMCSSGAGLRCIIVMKTLRHKAEGVT